MVNKSLKRRILNHPATRRVYEIVRNAYVKFRAGRKCARLRRHGCEILSEVESALRDSGLSYFIDYGTLLGFAREHAFIRHDDDIDYTVLAETGTPKEVYDRISRLSGFSFSHAFEFRGQITELTFKFREIEVDFFFAYPHGTHGGHFCSAYDRYATVAYPSPSDWSAYGMERSLADRISRRRFLSVTVPVPDNCEQVLTECYGRWREVVKSYDNHADYGQRRRIDLPDFAHRVTAARVLEIGDIVDGGKFEDVDSAR